MVYRPRDAARPPRRPPPEELGLAREIVTLTLDGDRARARQAPRRDRPLEGLRHPARRPERLAPPRRGAPGGLGLLARRPRLDERLEVNGRRTARAKLESGDTITIGSTELVFDAEARRVTARLGRGRRGAARPEDRVPRPALPLHLADRAHRRPRPAAAAGELRSSRPAGAGAGCSAAAAGAPSPAGSSSSRARRSRRARSRARLGAADARPRRAERRRARRRRVRLGAARARSSRAATASGSRTSAPRTAPSSTAPRVARAAPARARRRRPRRRDRPEVRRRR